MSKRPITLCVLTVSVWGCVPLTDRVSLVDGRSVSTSINGGKINFDGKSTLTVTVDQNKFVIDARVPSIVTLSRDRNYLLLNFGDGSGQIYDIELINIKKSSTINIDYMKREVLEFASSKKCRASKDNISYIFKSWKKNSIQIATEDWTRVQGCGSINKSWSFTIKD